MAPQVKVRINWDVGGFVRRQESRIVPRLVQVGKLLRDSIKEAISEPFAVGGGGSGGKGSLSGVVTRWNPQRTGVPSKPGEPPKYDLGNLYKSIHYRVDRRKLVVSVYTDSPYGRYLEIGTGKMAARPYIRPTLARLWPQILRIMRPKT